MGILQARIQEWVVMTSSRGSSQPRDRTQISHIAGRIIHYDLVQETLIQFLGWEDPLEKG